MTRIKINQDMLLYINELIAKQENKKEKCNQIFSYNDFKPTEEDFNDFFADIDNEDASDIKTKKVNVVELFNKRVRNANYYNYDKYNIIIRKNNYEDSSSPFGWVYIKTEDSTKVPISIHIKKSILKYNDSKRIYDDTLQFLKSRFNTLFIPPKGILYRLYCA